MSRSWPTAEDDMQVAARVIEEYAEQVNSDTLGMFELVVNHKEKSMGFRLSNWVLALAEYFMAQYGPAQGDFVTRKVVSRCLINGQTLH